MLRWWHIIQFIVIGIICTADLVNAQASKSSEPKRSIILITIDTIRADFLSCNGSKIVKTPSLDALALQGVNFLRTRAHVPLTLPSHASIMTALYPLEHGVRDNGIMALQKESSTLAEILKKNRYLTAAFVGSFVLDKRFGLDQGFDVYDDRMPADTKVLEKLEAERNAGAVYSAFSNWLKQADLKRPFFVWIHFYDPHAPYDPPQPYHNQYAKNLYAGEIAYTDSVIGKIHKDLESKISNDFILAVAGDHGEGLGDHQEATHSLLIYNSTLHVPMILVAPNLISPNTKFQNLSRLVDLAPTLLDYAGIGEKLVGQGISLRNAIDQKKSTDVKSFNESLYPKLNLGWSELRGIESGEFHYIDAPKPELYNVINDPGETQNKIKQHTELARKLRTELNQFYKSKTKPPPDQAEMDPETKEKLASLGYLSGSETSTSNSQVVDPKDKMKVWNDIQLGIFEFGRENYDSAARLFETVLKTEKNTRIVYDNLCSSYIRLERWAQAKTCVETALEQKVDFPSLHIHLGLVYQNEKKYDLAQKEFERAIAKDPLNVSAHYYLGNTYRAMRKWNEALSQYQQALRLSPENVFALNGMAMTYAVLTRDQEALDAFQKAVKAAPDNPSGYFNLAVQAERMNRVQEALEAYQKFLTISDEKHFPQQRQKAKQALQKLRS